MRQTSLLFLMFVSVAGSYNLNAIPSRYVCRNDQEPPLAKTIIQPSQMVTFDAQAGFSITNLPPESTAQYRERLNQKYDSIKNGKQLMNAPELGFNFDNACAAGCASAEIVDTPNYEEPGLIECSPEINHFLFKKNHFLFKTFYFQNSRNSSSGVSETSWEFNKLNPDTGKIFISCLAGKFNEAIYAFSEKLTLELRGPEGGRTLTFTPEDQPLTRLVLDGHITATEGQLLIWGDSPYTLTLSQEATRGKS